MVVMETKTTTKGESKMTDRQRTITYVVGRLHKGFTVANETTIAEIIDGSGLNFVTETADKAESTNGGWKRLVNAIKKAV